MERSRSSLLAGLLALAGLAVSSVGGALAPASAQTASAGAPAGVAGLTALADADQDGAISRAEFRAARTGWFPTLDRNADGWLSSEELESAAPGGRGRFLLSRQFRTLDANGNGRIEAAEYASGPAPLFDLADGNRDDRLDAGEIAAARRKASG
jgi:Ca2+-binding EF-hand superfamily protein